MNHAGVASLAAHATQHPNWSVDEPRTYGDTHLLTNHSELISKLRRHCRIAFAMMQVHSEKIFRILVVVYPAIVTVAYN